MKGTDVSATMVKARQLTFRMFRSERDEWLTSIIAVMTGTTACTPIMGAKMADIRKPPATPVAPCIAEVTNAPTAITTNKSLEASPNREAIMG
jgi:hypothetical protein